METWRIIEDAPNYLISSYGRVKNRKTERILKQTLDGYRERGGYLCVTLSYGGRKTNKVTGHYVHILVANAFIRQHDENLQVNHIDGNKTNNSVWNLEWCTTQENTAHASKTGLMGKRIMIVETGQIFKSARDCAKHIDGQGSGISNCLSGRAKTHKGFTFELLD